jgi:hypothetical protein
LIFDRRTQRSRRRTPQTTLIPRRHPTRSWGQIHVAGPTNLRIAPLPAHNYVGEYQGLAGLTRGRGFAAVFTLAAPQAKDGPTDIFFARIEPGR